MLRRFGGETVLLNVDTGQYHGLDATGGAFLEALTSSDDLDGALAALGERYEAPADRLRGDLSAFLRELRERGLVVDDDAPL